QVCGSDAIQDHIDPAPIGCRLNLGSEVALAIIDRDIGAELEASIAFLVAASSHDRSHPRFLEQQDRGGAHAAPASVNQRGFALPPTAITSPAHSRPIISDAPGGGG